MIICVKICDNIIVPFECRYETQLLELHEKICDQLGYEKKYCPTIVFNNTPLDIDYNVHYYGLLDNDMIEYFSNEGNEDHLMIKTESNFLSYHKKYLGITKNVTRNMLWIKLNSDDVPQEHRRIIVCGRQLSDEDNIFEIVKNSDKPYIYLCLRLRGD